MKLSNSGLSAFRKCPRYYASQYVARRVPVRESEALALGRAYHIGLETWWNAHGRGGTRETCLACSIDAVRQHADGMSEQDVAKVCAMLSQYAPPDGWRVEAVEQWFESPIRNPDTGYPMRDAVLVGRVDLVLSNDAGERWIVEHKTTSDEIIGYGPYWQRLEVDSQVRIYLQATDAVGLIYDAARKPSIKLCAKDANAEAYMQRCIEQRSADTSAWYQWRQIQRTAEEMAEAAADLWQSAHMLHECARDNRWPRNGDACRNLYGTCAYLDVCTGKASLGDDSIFRDKE
jgi:hypothetical protein